MHVSQGRMSSAHSESSAYLIGLPIFSRWYDGKYVEGAYTWHSRIIVVETSVNESQAIVILKQELNGIGCFTQWDIHCKARRMTEARQLWTLHTIKEPE